MGYILWGCKESDTTEQRSTHSRSYWSTWGFYCITRAPSLQHMDSSCGPQA